VDASPGSVSRRNILLCSTKAITLNHAVLLHPPILKGNIKPCLTSSSAIKFSDFSKWKPAYDAHLPTRQKAGLKEEHLLRNTDDPNEVVLLFEAKDIQKAKEFASSADLREAMQNAGVVDKPDIYFLGLPGNRNPDSTVKRSRSGQRHRADHAVKRARISPCCVWKPPERWRMKIRTKHDGQKDAKQCYHFDASSCLTVGS
jgi:hypothetical protein